MPQTNLPPLKFQIGAVCQVIRLSQAQTACQQEWLIPAVNRHPQVTAAYRIRRESMKHQGATKSCTFRTYEYTLDIVRGFDISEHPKILPHGTRTRYTTVGACVKNGVLLSILTAQCPSRRTRQCDASPCSSISPSGWREAIVRPRSLSSQETASHLPHHTRPYIHPFYNERHVPVERSSFLRWCVRVLVISQAKNNCAMAGLLLCCPDSVAQG